jgi:glycosyltransferase involved in cell wall biosynthesis
LLSVVIPVFNPGPLLGTQLEALAQQDWDEAWEVVLADNGCTDGSLDAVTRVREKLQIRIIDASDRRGPSHARNRGAEEAVGEWLAFCDSDDVAEPSWLRELWSARDTGDLVGGACDVTALNDSRVLQARGGPTYGLTLPEGPCRFLPYLPSCNLLIRRDAFFALGKWDDTLPYCEDVDFSWRAQLGGRTLGFARNAVMKYRFRPSTRELFRQIRRYKAAEAQLFIRYRAQGAKRQSAREVVGRFWWLLSRSPYVALGLKRRTLWCSVAGSVIGRIQGSLRYRVVYL